MIKKMLPLPVALLVFGVFFATFNGVKAADVFEVKGVYVDVTAENVTKARQQAMREGQDRAFKIMLNRLTLKSDRDFLPWVEPDRQPQYIRNFSVSGEKTSAVRYIASYTYHFKEDAIRQLLRSRGLSFAETISKPVLILPLFDDGGKQTLWDEPNPWRSAWSKIPTQNGLVPLALPLGDLADISGLSAKQAANVNEAALSAMAQRYGVNSVVVAHLVVAGRTAQGQPKDVDLVINRYGDKNAGRNTLLGLTMKEGEAPEAFLVRVAQELVDTIEESWKRDNLLQFGVTDVIPVNLAIANLQEWISVKKRLETVAVIRNVEVALLSRDTVQLNLHFLGGLDQLISSLKQVDIDLSVNGESWALVNLKG